MSWKSFFWHTVVLTLCKLEFTHVSLCSPVFHVQFVSINSFIVQFAYLAFLFFLHCYIECCWEGGMTLIPQPYALYYFNTHLKCCILPLIALVLALVYV